MSADVQARRPGICAGCSPCCCWAGMRGAVQWRGSTPPHLAGPALLLPRGALRLPLPLLLLLLLLRMYMSAQARLLPTSIHRHG